MSDPEAQSNGDADSSLKRKGEEDMDTESGDIKKAKQDEVLKFLVYKDLPYEEQLQKKLVEVEHCFKTFHTSFANQYPELGDWHKNQLLKWFRIESIRPAPKVEGYRNKCELTIGFNPELGKLGAGVKTSMSDSTNVEINTTDESYIHLPKSMIDVAQEFSDFLEPYNNSEEMCPYLYLHIRSNKEDQLMVMVIVQAENDTDETFNGYKQEVVKFLTEDNEKVKSYIKSIYLQARPNGCTKKSFELSFSQAWGDPHLLEEVLDCTILVTPSLFFNINTTAAELVYKNVIEMLDLRKKKTLVVDLFCGCGVLSMVVAKKARQVIAIDPSKWNIRQAKAMAAHNNINNIQFVIGRPDEALGQVWNQMVQADEVVIIIDPPSNSRPRFYVELIGDMNNLSKVIYLNSNSKSNVVKNLMTLTEAALLPVRVVPVDIAPHTIRMEMVVLCKKFDVQQIARPLVQETRGMHGQQDPVSRGWGDAAGWSSGLGASDLERIERRAFAMGLAKGASSFGPKGGSGDRFYDDYPNRPARMGFGYGGPSQFGDGFGRPAWGSNRGRGGRF